MEASDEFPGMRRDQVLTENHIRLNDAVKNRKSETITVQVAAALGSSGNERRETDFVSVTTPFSTFIFAKNQILTLS